MKLTIESGESQLFTTLPIRIGRAENNDLVLPDETVSSHHAQIYYDEIVDDICIVDLGSLNGLLVDDHPTHRNVLYDGTKIGLGAATLLYRDTGFIYTGQADSGSSGMIICPNCGTENRAGAKFCKNCAMRLPDNATATKAC